MECAIFCGEYAKKSDGAINPYGCFLFRVYYLYGG